MDCRHFRRSSTVLHDGGLDSARFVLRAMGLFAYAAPRVAWARADGRLFNSFNGEAVEPRQGTASGFFATIINIDPLYNAILTRAILF